MSSKNLRNPYYIGDQPGLTQTLGWADAWTTKPSVYAVAARNAHDIAAAVNFARENVLRLVVKGGGHSYQGTSNAPDSLLVWTRHMNDITMHDAFVPQGCEGKQAPQPAVTLGAGTIWMHAYDAVTTKAGKYVQGGGCTTVGVAGLIQSGGFGSFSKHYGLAAAGLLEAEVVTADGKIRIANACTNPDLFWALKGGGGGSFGVVSKLTLRVRDLPEFFGGANFTVKASSDDAFPPPAPPVRELLPHQPLQRSLGRAGPRKPDNSLAITMVSYGLDTDEAKKVWQPFLDWVAHSPADYTLKAPPIIGSMPARHWWDAELARSSITNRFSSPTRVPARTPAMSGGRATRARSDSSFTASSRSGCPRHCLRTIRKIVSSMRCSPLPVTGKSNCISTKVSPALPPTPSPRPATPPRILPCSTPLLSPSSPQAKATRIRAFADMSPTAGRSQRSRCGRQIDGRTAQAGAERRSVCVGEQLLRTPLAAILLGLELSKTAGGEREV